MPDQALPPKSARPRQRPSRSPTLDATDTQRRLRRRRRHRRRGGRRRRPAVAPRSGRRHASRALARSRHAASLAAAATRGSDLARRTARAEPTPAAPRSRRRRRGSRMTATTSRRRSAQVLQLAAPPLPCSCGRCSPSTGARAIHSYCSIAFVLHVAVGIDRRRDRGGA